MKKRQFHCSPHIEILHEGDFPTEAVHIDVGCVTSELESCSDRFELVHIGNRRLGHPRDDIDSGEVSQPGRVVLIMPPEHGRKLEQVVLLHMLEISTE